MKNVELLDCNFKPFEGLGEIERVSILPMLSGEAASLCSVVSHMHKNLFYLSMHKGKHLNEFYQRELYGIYNDVYLLVQRIDSINFDLLSGDGVE